MTNSRSYGSKIVYFDIFLIGYRKNPRKLSTRDVWLLLDLLFMKCVETHFLFLWNLMHVNGVHEY